MKVVKRERATSILAELIRNGIIDTELLATHFRVEGATDVDTIYYQDGIVEFSFDVPGSA